MSHSEVLGNEQLLTCRLLDGQHLVQVRADPDLTVRSGSRVHLEPDPNGWRLFDQHGEAIPVPEAAPPAPREPTLPEL